MSAISSRRGVVLIAGVIVAAVVSLAQNALQVGYAVVTPDAGSAVPVVASLLRSTNSQGSLVSETNVPAVRPAQSGAAYIDESGLQTGLVFVNPSEQSANVTLSLRDAAGIER